MRIRRFGLRLYSWMVFLVKVSGRKLVSSQTSYCLVFYPRFSVLQRLFMNRLEFSCFLDFLYGFWKPEFSMVFCQSASRRDLNIMEQSLESLFKLMSKQCCGSGMFIPDPGSWFLPIPDPGSRIPDPKTATKERGEKKLVVIPFYVATNFTKL